MRQPPIVEGPGAERRLTAKGTATRARIIVGAAVQLREESVENTTLDDIRNRTRTSKSQLFHYFPGGKDQLLLEVARYESDQVLADQQPYLGDLSTWTAWYQWRDALIHRYEALGDTCPLGSLFLQIGRDTPGAQAIVQNLMERWQNALADGMHTLRRHGSLAASFEVEKAAPALLCALQGGVTLMLATGHKTHLETAVDYHLAQMRRHATTQE